MGGKCLQTEEEEEFLHVTAVAPGCTWLEMIKADANPLKNTITELFNALLILDGCCPPHTALWIHRHSQNRGGNKLKKYLVGHQSLSHHRDTHV